MFHPFRKVEAAWNARTPVWLHNGTKENLIVQFTLVVLMILGFIAKDWYDDRQAAKRRAKLNIEEHIVKIR